MARLVSNAEGRWIQDQMTLQGATLARQGHSVTRPGVRHCNWAQIHPDPNDDTKEVVEVSLTYPDSIVYGKTAIGWADQDAPSGAAPSEYWTMAQGIDVGADFYAVICRQWDADTSTAPGSKTASWGFYVVQATYPSGTPEQRRTAVLSAVQTAAQAESKYIDGRAPLRVVACRVNGKTTITPPGMITDEVPPDELSIEYRASAGAYPWGLQVAKWEDPASVVVNAANVTAAMYLPLNDSGNGNAMRYLSVGDLVDEMDDAISGAVADEATARTNADDELSGRIAALEQGATGPFWVKGGGVSDCYGADIGDTGQVIVIRLDGKCLIGDWTVDNTAGGGGGNLTVNAGLSVREDAHVIEDLIVDQTASVDGDTSIGGDLTVAGVANITGDLTASANASVTQQLTVGGDLSLAGTASISTDLLVAGDAEFNGNVQVNVGTTTYKLQPLTVSTPNGTANILAFVPV